MTTCIICGAERTRKWVDGKSAYYYCERCARLKNDAVGGITHVMRTLYLGDAVAAANFDGVRLCVYETEPDYATRKTPRYHHIPILVCPPNSSTDRCGALASIYQLEQAMRLIDDHLARGELIIVHCHGGVERSPLTVAWFLTAKQHYPTLAEAYAFLKGIRPVIADRTSWLPPVNPYS